MSSQTRNRACVFIGSNNLNQTINLNSHPIVKVPFPPVIDPHDLVKTKNGKIPVKVPNAFIIYRKMFIETARNGGYYLPMTIISSMTSQSWEQESDVVKAEYRRLSKEASEVRNEMLPKSQRKRKREKWNIISFGNQSAEESQYIQDVIPNVPNNPTISLVKNDLQKLDDYLEQPKSCYSEIRPTTEKSPEGKSIKEEVINSIDLVKNCLKKPDDDLVQSKTCYSEIRPQTSTNNLPGSDFPNLK